MYYCSEKGITCDRVNSHGYCSQTACTNWNALVKAVNSDVKPYQTEYNICEICGRHTESITDHLCRKCRNALIEIIYGDR